MSEVTIYSPYEKVQDFWADATVADVPNKLRDYLCVFPTPECPNPILTNANPRVRLMKYLYYDGAKPLEQPMPTIKQRKEIIFDPDNPTSPPTSKGYRLYSQVLSNPTEYDGKTILRIAISDNIPKNPYKVMVGVTFYILSNYTEEAGMKSGELSRTYSMELAIIQALNGVNIGGVGTFMYDCNISRECGSEMIYDMRTTVGRAVTMFFESDGGTYEGSSY